MRRPETKARARALQLLYAWDVAGGADVRSVAARLAPLYGGGQAVLDRAVELAQRAAAGCDEYDRRTARATEHWRLQRVGVIEKNILRLAQAELTEGRTPPRVVIDEAVSLARWFGGEKTPAFVNGILDAVAHELGVL